MISEIDIEDMGPPQIEMIQLTENEDGSAVCELKTNTAGTRLLMEWGFNAMLRRALDEIHTDN
jgi:hypothetical protein